MTQTTSGATSSVFNAQNSVIAKDSSVASAYHFSSFFPKCFVPYHDPDIKGDNNVYETKVSIISKARSSALLDAVEEPGYHQRKKIDGILNRLPVTLEAMNVDDAMLLWQYRRFLTKNPRAFVPFMSSLSWTKPSDVQEAERLMPMWRPIAVEDALILLSRLFAVSLSLRKYAISILAKESKASLQQILLQLTQAARYDHPPATNLSRSSQFHSSDTRPSHLMEGEVQSFLLDRCLTSWALLSNLYWYVSVESELEHGWIINQVIQNRQEIARNAADAAAIAAQRSGKSTKKNLKPNTVNLLSKEEMAEEPTLAEIMSLELSGTVFTRMRKNIMEKLKVTNILYYRRILKQKMLRESLTTLYKQLNSKKDRTQRIKYAKELINEKSCGLDELFPGTTKSGRGGGKVHSDVSLHNCEAGSEAGDVSGLFSTLARAGGSILKMSPTSGHSCEAALEGSLSFSGRGKWSAPPPLQASDSTDYDTPTFQSLKVTDAQIQMKRLTEQEEPIVHLPTHPIKAVNGITPDGVYLFKSAKMPIMLPFLEIRDYIDESEGILFQSPTHANTPAYPHKDTTDDSAINHPAPKASASTSTLNSSPALRNKCTIDDAGASGGSHSLSQSMSDEVVPFKVIFKSGDDVRQDQLVVQFIELMGNLLKSNGLDLCLTPYRVLATSENDGYVEVVPDVDTFQNVQKDVQGYLFRAVEEEYQLEQQALDKSKQIGVGVSSQNESLHAGTPIVTSAYLLETARKKKAAVMERFIKSCAGYCVITFLLGIGDRHLENLLITKDGRLLHIDFGFIFGNDPKPFPPPMKINKEMVEAIGGVQSEGYAQFKTYCCSAYTILRKHSHLILNLLLLMIDASIHQISSVNGVMPPKFTHAVAKHSNGPFDLYPTVGAGSQQPTVPYVDPRVNLIKIQDKLRLDLNDAEATQYIQNVIADSVGSIFTNLWDVIHVAAQATRN